jgi:integrase
MFPKRCTTLLCSWKITVWNNLNLRKATVTVPKGAQRGNARTLPLNAAQIGALMQYLDEVRPRLMHADGGMLFVAVKKGGRQPVERVIAGNLSAHLKRMDRRFKNLAQLRASVITHWIKTVGLRKAQYWAGHKSIVCTEKYLPNHVEDLIGDMTKFNPF